MKYTEKTDNANDVISLAMISVLAIYSDKNYKIANLEIFIENLRVRYEELKTISIKEIKKEFWEVCDDLDKIKAMKRVFEVKFSTIMNWRPELNGGFSELIDLVTRDMEEFIIKQRKHKVNLTDLESTVICGYYTQILMILTILRSSITYLINQWEEMASPSQLIQENLALPDPPKFKLAFKKKTDFIKIISAMYDARMFETEDGYLASSKESLMIELGQLFGEDFSKYSVLLSKSKEPEKDVFLKPFDIIRDKAEKYYEKEYEKKNKLIVN